MRMTKKSIGFSLGAVALAASAPASAQGWWDSFKFSGAGNVGITLNPDVDRNRLNIGHLFTDRANDPMLHQLLVTAELADGSRVDATRLARFNVDPKVGAVSPAGLASPTGNGRTALEASLGGRTASATLEVVNHDPAAKVDFLRDVNPVLSQLGCSSGPCHGAKDGKAGFKLPATSGRTVLFVSTVDGLADKVVIKALGDATFDVTAKRTVRQGARQSLVVSGRSEEHTSELQVTATSRMPSSA